MAKQKKTFKEKVKGALEVLCVSIINFFGVKLWSRLSIFMVLATWLCLKGKLTGYEWLIAGAIFTGTDFARSKWLKGNGDGSTGTPVIDKIKRIVMDSE